MSLLNELKKRNVIRVAIAYGVIAWLLIQVLGLAASSFEAPTWVMKMIITVIAIGFVPVLLFSWAFELTPEGLKREKDLAPNGARDTGTAKKLNYITIAAAIAVVGLGVFQRVNPPSPTIAQQIEHQNLEQQDGELAQKDENKAVSIAVLPFSDFSANKDQEYFADGISEELLNVLARIKGLLVSSRTSAFAFKNQDVSISEIGDALNVAHVLEGSIRKSGNTLRITAQLIDTKTDVHLWSETYDRPLTADNIFAIQDEIAAAIVNELQGHLNFEVKVDSNERTQSVEAYQLYLRAREQMNQRKPEPLNIAADAFKQVIALDPNFAPAYSGLADTYNFMVSYADMDSKKSKALAKPLIEKALELAPYSAEALVSASTEFIESGDFQGANKLLDKALASNPSYVPAYQRKAALQGLSNLRESISTLKRALELDPLSAVLLHVLAQQQLQLGDVGEARKTIENNIRWNPGSPFGYEMLGELYSSQAKYAQAHGYLKEAQALNPDNVSVNRGLISIYLHVGLHDRARKMAAQPETKVLVHSMLGEYDELLALYEQLDPGFQLEASFQLNEYEKFVELALPFTPGIIQNNQKLETNTQIYLASTLAFSLQAIKRPEADKYKKLLDDYFANKSPGDFEDVSILLHASMYQIVQGKTKGAYRWLEQMVQRGFTGAGFKLTKVFESLHGTPEFEAVLTRGEENAAKHRSEIEAQLAKPKPNWVD